jgi:hypothetical protein
VVIEANGGIGDDELIAKTQDIRQRTFAVSCLRHRQGRAARLSAFSVKAPTPSTMTHDRAIAGSCTEQSFHTAWTLAAVGGPNFLHLRDASLLDHFDGRRQQRSARARA